MIHEIKVKVNEALAELNVGLELLCEIRYVKKTLHHICNMSNI